MWCPVLKQLKRVQYIHLSPFPNDLWHRANSTIDNLTVSAIKCHHPPKLRPTRGVAFRHIPNVAYAGITPPPQKKGHSSITSVYVLEEF